MDRIMSRVSPRPRLLLLVIPYSNSPLSGIFDILFILMPYYTSYIMYMSLLDTYLSDSIYE